MIDNLFLFIGTCGKRIGMKSPRKYFLKHKDNLTSHQNNVDNDGRTI